MDPHGSTRRKQLNVSPLCCPTAQVLQGEVHALRQQLGEQEQQLAVAQQHAQQQQQEWQQAQAAWGRERDGLLGQLQQLQAEEAAAQLLEVTVQVPVHAQARWRHAGGTLGGSMAGGGARQAWAAALRMDNDGDEDRGQQEGDVGAGSQDQESVFSGVDGQGSESPASTVSGVAAAAMACGSKLTQRSCLEAEGDDEGFQSTPPAKGAVPGAYARSRCPGMADAWVQVSPGLAPGTASDNGLDAAGGLSADSDGGRSGPVPGHGVARSEAGGGGHQQQQQAASALLQAARQEIERLKEINQKLLEARSKPTPGELRVVGSMWVQERTVASSSNKQHQQSACSYMSLQIPMAAPKHV